MNKYQIARELKALIIETIEEDKTYWYYFDEGNNICLEGQPHRTTFVNVTGQGYSMPQSNFTHGMTGEDILEFSKPIKTEK